MQQNENLLNVLGILYTWRKQILYTCLAAAVVSIFCSLLLDNYYKSSTIFYAASPDLAKPAPVGTREGDQDFYGEEEDLDRLFSISSSAEVKDFIINKYNLYEHYGINPESKKGPYNIRKRFNKMYTSLKTKYGALQLSMEDKDPMLASQIANDAREKISAIAQQMIKDSQAKLLNSYKQNITTKQQQSNTLNDSLFALRNRYNIYNTESQGQVYAELLARIGASLNDKKARLDLYKSASRYRDSIRTIGAAIKGLEKQQVVLEEQVGKFNEGLAKVMALEYEQRDVARQLNLDKERYKQLQSTYDFPFNAMHVVEKAEAPLMKSRPFRSIIVLASVFIAFILSSLFVLLLHTYRNLNWDRITRDA